MRLIPAMIGLERHWFAVGGSVLLALLVLYATVAGRPNQAVQRALPSQLRPLAAADGVPARLSADGQALLLAQDRSDSAELHFVIPRQQPDTPHWVVWFPRAPVRDLRLTAGDRWATPSMSFLRPIPVEGPMPVGYMVSLPSTWEGDIRLRIDATGLRVAALRPQVMPEALMLGELQRATILTVFAYASLCALGLMGLALFYAARDWSFFSFFGYCTVSVLSIAAFNGHIYVLDVEGVLAGLGGAGTQAIALVFEAACLRIVQRFADLPTVRPRLARTMNILVVSVLLLALSMPLWRERFTMLESMLLPAVWLLGGILCLTALLDALRRRVPMAGATLVAAAFVVVLIGLYETAARGYAGIDMFSLYGYQIAIVVVAMLLGVGLISRVSKYRQQRDQEQRARADSERRMYREAVRVELLTSLQTRLRDAEEEHIQTIGLRTMLEHVRKVVPMDAGFAVLKGHQARDAYTAWPIDAGDEIAAHALQRLPLLRQTLGGSAEQQQPVVREGATVPVAIEAILPLSGVRAPAWGMLLLQRSGATPFHPEELSIARELARIALHQVDEAFAALRLRLSAEVDALTGSLNRRSVDQALVRVFQKAHRDRQPVSVLFIDLDHFKTFNDVYGHACGDECLRMLARTMGEALSDDDIFGRYGGEEFIAILPGRPTEVARAIAEGLRVAVEACEVEWEGRKLRMTVSIGVAVRQEHEALPQPTLERADKALYAAKRGGRNRVRVAPAFFAGRPTTAL